MMKTKLKLTGLLSRFLLVWLVFGPAPVFATSITGSISFSDGFQTLGQTNFIVSQLNDIDVFNNIMETFANNCTGAFGSCTSTPIANGGSSDFSFGGGLQTIYNYNGFEFKLASFDSITRTPLSCSGGFCNDVLIFTGSGVVSGNGFDPTPFNMLWTANGSCLGSGEACTDTPSGSWSASISATGPDRAPGVTPEPTAILLFGMGLLGVGVALRKQ